MKKKKDIIEIEKRLYEIEKEKAELLKELLAVKEKTASYNIEKIGNPVSDKVPETPEAEFFFKIDLFFKNKHLLYQPV